MNLFLNGGGDGAQTAKALARAAHLLDPRKPCLYIPLAMEPAQYDGCERWIREELRALPLPRIDMVRSAEELAALELSDYGMLFLGGGNTFTLLHRLKASGAFAQIARFLKTDGVVFGGSAGAIVFGADLSACANEDENEVDLADTRGFGVLGEVSLLCHYGNRTPEQDEESRRYLLALSARRPAMAIPETVTLHVSGGIVQFIGQGRCSVFLNGKEKQFSAASYFAREKSACITLD